MSNLDRLDGVSEGLGQKAPVGCATTGPILLTGLQTIDTVVQVEGTRTLVKDQVDPTENGIWNASSGPWTRALDFDGARDVVTGTQVTVAGGTQAGGLYRATIAAPGAIGRSAISFSSLPVIDGQQRAIRVGPAGSGPGGVGRMLYVD